MYDVEFEINQIMDEAFKIQASDIHFAPQKEALFVTFRIDGVLANRIRIDKKYQDKILNRIKIMSNIDIGERRKPQDGRWPYDVENQTVTMRVSTMPTIWGEKIVLRILGQQGIFHTLEALGMPVSVQHEVQHILARPYGLFLVTGPTGSGKSSTLYALLNALNGGQEHIICLENPVEYEIKGASQVEINEKAGLTFANGLRAALRQDPDIIMVGEIRDSETAHLAVQAALTGHKVLSTIHTNTAEAVVERLIDMGVEPFLVRAALIGALAQRLVRRPCSQCYASPTMKGGCPVCFGSGYSGRVALYELFSVPREDMDWNHPKGYVKPTLAEAGRVAVETGHTTTEEMVRMGIIERENRLEVSI